MKRESPEATTQGGVLVFFPTYTVMENIIARWKTKGIFDTLKHELGSIVVESRGSGKAEVVKSSKTLSSDSSSTRSKMFHFGGNNNESKKVNPSEDDVEEEQLATVVQEFEDALKKYKRCLLLAVCRGKVSEGIDFSNNKGRVVIVTGN